MLNYIGRVISLRYLNYWIVLLLDTSVSVLCTFLAYLAVCFFSRSGIRLQEMLFLVLLSLAASAGSFYLCNTYRYILRHSTVKDLRHVLTAVSCKVLLVGLGTFAFAPDGNPAGDRLMLGILLDSMFTALTLVFLRIAVILFYDGILTGKNKAGLRVLIYGMDGKSAALEIRLRGSRHYRVAGFYVPGGEGKSFKIAGLPVYYFKNEEDFRKVIKKERISGILFARDVHVRKENDRLIRYCIRNEIKTLLAPRVNEIGEGGSCVRGIRDIKIEDLLGREEIRISLDEIKNELKDKTVLITGAAGSIGSEICRQIASFPVKKLILYDAAETPMHNLRLELEQKYGTQDFVPVVGDVRNGVHLEKVFGFYRPDMVFHAAAYKHVPLMEENPCEAVEVNVTGTRHVADLAVRYQAEKMIFISTDKAVNPTNIMGASKRLAEIYIQSLGGAVSRGTIPGKTRFITTRFGNVLGSNGSVVPHFRKQIERGGPVTVTHPDITRFFMSIPEACRLVLEAAYIGTGNDILVFEMGSSVKITDLARRMIELAGFIPEKEIKIEYTGLRPGEKLYEEVLSREENTLATSHKKIRRAHVREYDYSRIAEPYDRLEKFARERNIRDMVLLMKQLVPEFISKNSPFEKIDRKNLHLSYEKIYCFNNDRSGVVRM